MRKFSFPMFALRFLLVRPPSFLLFRLIFNMLKFYLSPAAPLNVLMNFDILSFFFLSASPPPPPSSLSLSRSKKFPSKQAEIQGTKKISLRYWNWKFVQLLLFLIFFFRPFLNMLKFSESLHPLDLFFGFSSIKNEIKISSEGETIAIIA